MELRYPYLIIIGIIIISIILFIAKKRRQVYSGGTKIANTHYIKKSTLYKKIVKKYKLIFLFLKGSCLLAIFSSLILMARPTVIMTIDDEKHNRDIILCMDVSASVNELNYQLVDNLKNVVKNLKGERFGISIFNTSSITLVPLTEDYDYVLSVLDQIKKSIDIYENYTISDNYYYDFNYLFSGTLEKNEIRGSSLIGDGLASCVYNFSDIDDKRTKIIIFSTDNKLEGTPLLSLDEAATLSKSKNIIVYGLAPKDRIVDGERFKQSIEKTGGLFFDAGKNVNNIVSNIESQSKSLIKSKIVKTQIDNPFGPFVLLVISSSILIILNKKVIA